MKLFCLWRIDRNLVLVVFWLLSLVNTLATNGTREEMYPTVPPTGIIQRFTLILTRKILPGHTRLQVLVNGSVPGPPLYLTLGNEVEVLVVNNIYDDVSSIHWHGLTMKNYPTMDGTINFTQCPIPNRPGNNTFLYRFAPDMPGTYWYHGHIHGQYSDGKLLNPIPITH